MLGGVVVVAGVVGEDRGLAAVQQTLPDALVAGEVIKGFSPVAGPGQGTGAIGQEHGPQPADDFGMVSGGHQVVEAEHPAVDDRGGPLRDGAVERGEDVVAGQAVSGAYPQAGEVDQWLESELRGCRVERSPERQRVDLLPAQAMSKIR